MLPRGSGCHWEEEPFSAGKGPGLHEPGGWLRKGRIPGKAEAGGDAQVRRPACHVCHEATRNWLARNARGTRAFGSAERCAKALPRNILLKTEGWKNAFLFLVRRLLPSAGVFSCTDSRTELQEAANAGQGSVARDAQPEAAESRSAADPAKKRGWIVRLVQALSLKTGLA